MSTYSFKKSGVAKDHSAQLVGKNFQLRDPPFLLIHFRITFAFPIIEIWAI